jgi:methionyl-tRNA formyltransferase
LANPPASSRLRLAFFGTPDFAIPTLERLLGGRHELAVVVCQPDRRRGRGRAPSPAPVAQLALRARVPLIRAERVGDALDELRAHAPDLGVVVAFGQLLPRAIREAPTRGYLINGHASLLPRYRGAAPIARCILDGERVTGVSVMRVERELDAGPVALQRELAIGERENAGELAQRLARLTADALEEVIEQIAGDRVRWIAQDDARASYAPKLARADARLDWRDGALALCRRVRAMAPTPGAFTTLAGAELRILDAVADRAGPPAAGRAADARAERAGAADGSACAPPGSVRYDSAGALRVATGDGWLLPLVIQRPGKRALDVEAFLRGCAIPDGARLE